MDFSNTFDSISHNYMLDLLELLHFSSNFICTIQNLTYQTSTHILFNKSVSNINIPIQRGSALTRALNIIDTFSEVSELLDLSLIVMALSIKRQSSSTHYLQNTSISKKLCLKLFGIWILITL
eukprot:TRINITY_DN1215_c1_g1_i5.p1 TRINITY_DN1215_c1_g1~~TRINITY_DN1215_c1_g1_i5.p1  ORF type:complete len:123 (+),score=4.46 TRINITY_DN1215_c1_g1_i5:1172-1540(+)